MLCLFTQLSEILHGEPMSKNKATAYTARQAAFGTAVEEAKVAPACTPAEEMEREVSKQTGNKTSHKSCFSAPVSTPTYNKTYNKSVRFIMFKM